MGMAFLKRYHQLLRMKSRNISIDIIRTISCLYIIGIWHLVEYTSFAWKDGAFAYIGALFTTVAMGAFSFVSGICMQKYHFSKFQDCIYFLKKRIIRFYPLFFISAFSLLCAGFILSSHWFIDNSQFILTITGLSLLFPPTAPTLWFISMCMLFYYLTPFILWKRSENKPIMTFLRVFILILIIYICHYLSKGYFIDFKLLIYLPLYALGLLFPYNKYNFNKNSITLLICLFIALLICIYLKYTSLSSPLFCILLGLFGTLLLTLLSKGISHNGIISRFPIQAISYASMAAYLFHRQIYEVIYVITGEFNIISAIIAVSVVFILAYYIQYIYDKFITRFRPSI